MSANISNSTAPTAPTAPTTSTPLLDLSSLHVLLSQLNPEQKRVLNSFIGSMRIFFEQSLSKISDTISGSSVPLSISESDVVSEDEFIVVTENPLDATLTPASSSITAPSMTSPSMTSANEVITNYPYSSGIYSGIAIHNALGILVPHGKGKLVSASDPNFVIYDGEFKTGAFHGQGTFRHKSGGDKVLEKHGIFESGRFVKGTMDCEDDGSFYTGEVSTDWNSKSLPHGQGEMRYPDGTWYKGSWEKGVYEGMGEKCYKSPLGNYLLVYRGLFNLGLFHGCGKVSKIKIDDPTKAETLCCEGTFRKNLKHGQMVHYYKSYAFTSRFSEGVEEQIVTAVSTDPAIIIKGPAKGNSFLFHGLCNVIFGSDEFKYSGFIDGNIFNRGGTSEWTADLPKGTKTKFEGMWCNHHLHLGTLFYSDGAKYYGYFNDENKRCDKYGSMTYPDGRSVILDCSQDPPLQELNDPKIGPKYANIDIKIPSLQL